jgi:hypothetical protein
MRRAVVTGLGAVTPLGVGWSISSPYPAFKSTPDQILLGIRRTWKRLLDGECGIKSVLDQGKGFEAIPSQVGGIVPKGRKEDGGWTASEWATKDVSRHRSNRTSDAHPTGRSCGKLPNSRTMDWRQQRRHWKMLVGNRRKKRTLKPLFVYNETHAGTPDHIGSMFRFRNRKPRGAVQHVCRLREEG